MIFTDRKITIRNGKSSINEPVILYRGDYEVSIKFTIMESKFRFKSGVNLVDSEKASHGQLAILAPYGGNVFSEIVKCEDGTVTFTLTKEMIDQLEEVGLYSFQIRLFDYYRESRVSIPPVEFGIEVREPVASEDHDNEVNNAIVGYSIAKVVNPKEENVGPTFDDNGNYNKTDWETGDRITEGKLNKIEDALDKINQNEINNSEIINKRITSNFNVINAQLDQKANNDEVMKKGYATLNDFDEDTRAIILDMEPGTINAVLGEKNVKYNNTDFVDIVIDDSPFTPVDLYNEDTVSEPGYFANLTDGVIVNTQYTQSYVNTGFMEYHESVKYVLVDVSNMCFYDANKVFISSEENPRKNFELHDDEDPTKDGRILEAPSNCKYIIYNIDKTNISRAHIWQMTRYQYSSDATLTIPRLDLNKKAIFYINGIEANDNSVSLTASDIGAVEPVKNRLSNSLPYTVSSDSKYSRCEIQTTAVNGNDILIAKSINEFFIKPDEWSTALCSFTADADKGIVTATSNGAITGWFRSYVNIPIRGLTGGATYTLYAPVERGSGYGSGKVPKGTVIYDSNMTNLGYTTFYVPNLTFTAPDNGEINVRLYPSGDPLDGTANVQCRFEGLMLCKNEDSLERFIPYSYQEKRLVGNDTIIIDTLPLMTIKTMNGLYDSSVKVSGIVEVGKVSSVNGYSPNEYGEVDIPKTILSGKKIVCFGDSITEFGTYPQQVGEILGATTYNVGVGGCRMSRHPDSGYDAFSMTKLAYAIANKDYSVQLAGHNKLLEIQDDNTKMYETLIGINFEDVDYITIAFGTNDFGGGIDLGTTNDQPSNSTFHGAIKYVIETILKAYPHIKLFFMTPIFRWNIPGAGYNSDTTPVSTGAYLNDYAKAIIDECYMYHIPVLDMYNKSNINAFNHEYYISSDGTHPTPEGYTLIAEKLSKFLLSN